MSGWPRRDGASSQANPSARHRPPAVAELCRRRGTFRGRAQSRGHAKTCGRPADGKRDTKFAAFMAAGTQRLYRIAYLLTQDPSPAEELTQHALARTYALPTKRPVTGPGSGTVAAWARGARTRSCMADTLAATGQSRSFPGRWQVRHSRRLALL
ncbi:hypothetical protein GCM10022255_113230 [Dactylosporangium darangshiense]|uniref:RNA polymerase sigma-70 region 2 domain-containing protein n=1 Tax=Dactylosporangium darangshiense TaxID=579108 RepID=A0ABP8DVF0_9ACTN